MMVAVVMATLLLATTAVSAPASSAPMSSPSQASTPPASTPLSDAKDNLERVQALYTESCGDRSYGAYDDLCNQLATQVKQYHVELDRLQRAADRESTSSAHPKS